MAVVVAAEAEATELVRAAAVWAKMAASAVIADHRL
jgi:hypothetical protein